MNKNCTPVIFRKFSKGEIVAMFPTLPGTGYYLNYDCDSYMHVGEHGVCNLEVINVTKPATRDEYESLLRKLVYIGYDNLKVYKRIQPWMCEKRKEECY